MAEVENFMRPQEKGKRGRPRVFDTEEDRHEFIKHFTWGRATSRRSALNFMYAARAIEALAEMCDDTEEVLEKYGWLFNSRKGRGQRQIMTALGRLPNFADIAYVAEVICWHPIKPEASTIEFILLRLRQGDDSLFQEMVREVTRQLECLASLLKKD